MHLRRYVDININFVLIFTDFFTLRRLTYFKLKYVYAYIFGKHNQLPCTLELSMAGNNCLENRFATGIMTNESHDNGKETWYLTTAA